MLILLLRLSFVEIQRLLNPGSSHIYIYIYAFVIISYCFTSLLCFYCFFSIGHFGPIFQMIGGPAGWVDLPQVEQELNAYAMQLPAKRLLDL